MGWENSLESPHLSPQYFLLQENLKFSLHLYEDWGKKSEGKKVT